MDNKTISPIFMPNKAVIFKIMRACIGVEKIEDLWISLVTPGTPTVSQSVQSPYGLKNSQTNMSQLNEYYDELEKDGTNENGEDQAQGPLE